MRKMLTQIVGPRRAAKEKVWKILNIVVVATMVANVSFLGSLIRPKSADAASIGSYDQCANDLGDGYSSGDTGCRWINGNLQANNSLYHEGDATVQRVWLDGFVPGSSHSVTLQYGTTKQGKHAYDFLTSWNWSENWITEADLCQDITGCATAGASENTFAIPSDPNGSGQFETGTRNFVMRGGSLTGATTPSLSGLYTGDSDTSTTVSFDVASSGDMCTTKGQSTTCGIALFFGAHIAKTADWQPSDGTTGATSIPGSPYHVALAALDGSSIGNRDNQMQAGAIFQGNVIIEKQTIPDGSTQSFNFTSQTAALSGTLTDGGQIVASLNQGTYSVTEAATPGWTLTDVTCTDPSTNSSGNTSTGVASINVGANETVKCVFTNTRDMGQLNVVKHVENGQFGAASAGDWSLHVMQGGNDVANSPQAGNENGTTYTLPTGTYDVSETGGPSAYFPSFSQSCPDGSITVTKGGNATCAITNTYTPSAPNVTISKTDNHVTAQPGETLTYEVTLTNSGDSAANNVIVDDTLPSFLSTPTDITPNTGVYGSGHIIWTGLSVPGHGTTVVSYKATVNATMPVGTTVLHNIATLDCTRAEIQCGDPATDDTSVTTVNTIALDKTGPASATPGQSFTYSLAWSVAGNQSVTNAMITDPLPTNTTFVSATNGGTFAAGNVTWNLGTQAAGASGTVSVTVIVSPSLTSTTTLTNTGTFDTDQTQPVSDTVATTVTIPQVLGVSAEANLGITKSVDRPTANPGNTVTYTIVVSNTGDAPATSVVVTDNLPDGFTFVDGGKATKTWSLGTLAAHASQTLTYKVKIGATVKAGQHVNRAFVTADFFDPIAAEAIVTVKVPQVLGLATTGAGVKDLITFIFGIGLLAAGFISFQQLRRRSSATA